jgi:predicted transcriptional regulator
MTEESKILEQVVQITTAYLEGNAVPAYDLPRLIQSVYTALRQEERASSEPVLQEPAVPKRRSVRRDHIVCLECGQKLKILKRHLERAHRLTPDDYLTKWELPVGYPFVAPEHSEARSQIAKSFGLGKKITASTSNSH